MSKCLCVPKTSSVLNARPNRLNVSGDDRAALLLLTLFASPFKSKSRLEAENAALRHQLIVLQRRVSGRVQLTNGDRLFLVMLYQRRGPTINGFEDSSVSRQRRSDPSRHPARGPHRICAGPRRPSLPLLPNLVFSTHSPPGSGWCHDRRRGVAS